MITTLRFFRPGWLLPLGLIVSALILLSAGKALAVNLTYSSDTNIAFSSPSVVFTIASGATAKSLVVNTTTMVVVIPTGSSFTLTSTSTNISYTGASSDSTRTLTCSGGTATLIISTSATAEETVTIFPANSQCGTNSG